MTVLSRPGSTRRAAVTAALVAALVAGVAVSAAAAPAGAATSAATSAAADTAVSLAAPVYAGVVVGGQPNLPASVTVNTASGGQRSAAVTWDLSGYSFADPYRSVTVYGTVDDGLPVSAQVESVPASLVYYIDSGLTGQGSAAYAGAKSLLGPALLNGAADQASTNGSWGYVTSTGFGGVQSGGAATDKDANGIYGKNSSAESLTYSLPNLPAGTYTITAGIREWWTGPRTMKLGVQAAGAASEVTVAGPTAVGAGSGYSKSAIMTGTFTQSADGTAVVRMTRTTGTEAPVIGWLAVAAGTVPVSTSIPSVATPTADVAAGIYKTAQTVSLASTTPGAVIYYTTDGSDASRTNGTKYTGPITVDQAETLKAVTFQNGLLSSQLQVAYDIQTVPAAGYTSVPVGKTWYDTSGDSIQAHGGGFLQKDGWYYWVGENKAKNNANLSAISLYKSKDLLNWQYVHDIITLATPNVCTTGSFSSANCNIERPKLMYNAATSTYVLWGHWETGTDYSASHLIVATSTTVDGDYQVVRNFRPGAGQVTTPDSDPTYTGGDSNWGYGSRDFTVFQDPDSSDAYLVSTQDSANMRVYKLTDDYTDVDWQHSYPLFVGQRREAPALVKVGDRFYVFTSSQSGWYPNQTLVSSTTDISDPNGWSALKPVGNNTTYYSQPTNIMSIQKADGTREYVYMGDHWNPNALGASTYVWLPLTIDGTDVSMDYHPVWSLASDGTISYPIREELVSQGKPATAALSSAAYPPSAANDGITYNLNTSGDSTNYYLPPTVPYSWQVDLQQPRDLTRVDLSFRSYNGSETYSGYSVSGSLDGTTWTRIASKLANTTVGFTSETLAGTYRYVRVDVANTVNDHNGSAAAWAAGLVEVQVYAAVPPVAPSVPQGVRATQTGDTAIDVAWSAPAEDGGSAVTAYRVYEAGAATPSCEVAAAETHCGIGGLALGSTHRYEVTAVNAAGESARSAATTAILLPEVPSDDGAKQAPAKGVLVSDDGWDTGLKDGNFTLTMNMYWGVNASLFKLYRDGTLVGSVPLRYDGQNAQAAAVPISGLANGTYVFTGVLVNSKGSTATQPLTVKVTDANPGTPVLSSDNWDNDGNYTVTANLWWGTNATSYTFYENGVAAGSGMLTAATPGAQQARLTVSGRPAGTYKYTVVFTNAIGSTTSAAIAVTVK